MISASVPAIPGKQGAMCHLSSPLLCCQLKNVLIREGSGRRPHQPCRAGPLIRALHFLAPQSNALCGAAQTTFLTLGEKWVQSKWLAFFSFLRCHILHYSFSFREKGNFVILCVSFPNTNTQTKIQNGWILISKLMVTNKSLNSTPPNRCYILVKMILWAPWTVCQNRELWVVWILNSRTSPWAGGAWPGCSFSQGPPYFLLLCVSGAGLGSLTWWLLCQVPF